MVYHPSSLKRAYPAVLREMLACIAIFWSDSCIKRVAGGSFQSFQSFKLFNQTKQVRVSSINYT